MVNKPTRYYSVTDAYTYVQKRKVPNYILTCQLTDHCSLQGILENGEEYICKDFHSTRTAE